MDLDIIQTDEANLALQSSGLDTTEDVEMEIDETIKSEQLRSYHGEDDKNFQPKYQALANKIWKDVKSEDLQVENFIGTSEIPKVRAVLEGLRSDMFMDFERDIPDYYLTNGPDEVKLESAEFIIKQEPGETVNNLGSAEPEKIDCAYETKRRNDFNDRVLTHKDPSEIEMFHCDFCSYRTKRKGDLRKHILNVHEKVRSMRTPANPTTMERTAKLWKCSECNYETKRRNNFNNHVLTHKDPSEIQMFPCPSCIYSSKRKDNLRTHIKLVHIDPSKVEIFHCSLCSHTSRRNRDLQSHIKKVHRTDQSIRSAPAKPDKVECSTLKCGKCNYETQNRGHFKGHMLVHKDPSEIEMFHCDFCGYRCKRKGDLQKHKKLVHMKDPSISVPVKSEKFECSTCRKTFKTSATLKNHQFVHIDPSTVTLWKCSECNYETKRRHNFDDHLLRHKDPSEIEMFQCASCIYRSKRKSCLRKHIQLVHLKGPPTSVPVKSEKFECSTCSKTFKTKATLKAHQVVHIDSSSVTLWKCSECNYETKRKSNFNHHALKHKDPSEIQMFHCALCIYSSKRKDGLLTHIKLVHMVTEIFQCSLCSHRSRRNCDLQRHIRQVHRKNRPITSAPAKPEKIECST